ncbi:MAG: hypothetical protein R3D57_06345 [Hyphomicrobiaceae bacterium]
MSMSRRLIGSALRLSAMAVACGAIAACSPGDVQLNGKLFDAMGVSSSSQAAREIDPKVPQRAPLVVPPSTASLPPPGSGTAVATAAPADQAWPTDPDQQAAATLAAKQEEQKKYCEEGRLKGNADDFDDTNKSKYTRCGNVWTLLFNQNLDQPENADDVPIIVQQQKQGQVQEELPEQE